MMRRITIALLLCSSMVLAAPAKPESVLQPGTSSLVTFRILFTTGSAYDPAGKEGLAALTASMLAQGGTRSLVDQCAS
jgi:zinc protease